MFQNAHIMLIGKPMSYEEFETPVTRGGKEDDMMNVATQSQACSGTILIVDDTSANLGVIVDSLAGYGFRVAIAQDGEEALERVAFTLPDLILLDVLMPGPDGYEVCRRLKADPATRDIPVIFMTALADSEHKLMGFAAGGVDYVTKPLQIEEIIARVDTHLRLRFLQKQLEEKNTKLQEYQAELEQQVVQRTAELSEANRLLREEIEEHSESERKFRALAENSPDLLIRYDRNCRRLYFNPAFEKITDMSTEQMLDQAPGEGWRGDMSIETYMGILREVMETGVAAESLMMWRKPNCAPIHYICHVIPEYDLHGKVQGVLTIGRNITALKEAEQRLEDSRMQLRELAASRDKAREEERKHIARELHDELGQFLTALRMNVSLLRIRFGKDTPSLIEHVKTMTELVDRNIQVVRNVASSLRPAALDMGIQSALEWLVDEFVTHSDIPCELHMTEEKIELDEQSETAVFRVVQESLTNVARHAEASQVTVSLQRMGLHYQVMVSDDGKGFDSDRPRKTSLGLIGMRERVLMLGGEFQLDSKPGRGTAVVVRIPAKAALAERA